MNVVLIHGSYHGAWCWDLFRPELERAGHVVTAVDLPIQDSTAGASVYAETVLDAVDRATPTIVVAHSMAGLVGPLVAAKCKVARLVFLAAFLPTPGLSANMQRGTEAIDPATVPTTAEWTDLGDDVWAIGPNTAREIFFHDATDDVASWSVARLRPQSYRIMNEITPLTIWPDVPAAYVVCRDDHAISAEWGRTAARERLHVEPLEIDGGHSPMLTRPAELALLLEPLLRSAG
ncbi:MAG TPA: alpha/beta hydrolase [Candidatus Limnocylindrales bacterium]|jgi:pimeloyl-ACP methyl ester carboxylesterase|nr:alpha/beta hydrolase [Candidatus Limnocylindrales bacterium]